VQIQFGVTVVTEFLDEKGKANSSPKNDFGFRWVTLY